MISIFTTLNFENPPNPNFIQKNPNLGVNLRWYQNNIIRYYFIFIHILYGHFHFISIDRKAVALRSITIISNSPLKTPPFDFHYFFLGPIISLLFLLFRIEFSLRPTNNSPLPDLMSRRRCRKQLAAAASAPPDLGLRPRPRRGFHPRTPDSCGGLVASLLWLGRSVLPPPKQNPYPTAWGGFALVGAEHHSYVRSPKPRSSASGCSLRSSLRHCLLVGSHRSFLTRSPLADGNVLLLMRGKLRWGG